VHITRVSRPTQVESRQREENNSSKRVFSLLVDSGFFRKVRRRIELSHVHGVPENLDIRSSRNFPFLEKRSLSKTPALNSTSRFWGKRVA